MSRYRKGGLTDEQREEFLGLVLKRGHRVGWAFDDEDDLTWVYINAGRHALCLRSDGCSSALLNGRYGRDHLPKGGEETIDIDNLRVPTAWVEKLMEKFMPGGGAKARKDDVEAALAGGREEVDAEEDPLWRDFAKLVRILLGVGVLLAVALLAKWAVS